MQTIKIDINETAQKQIDLIVDYLKRGQALVYPTDTVYGLGCDARNVLAVKNIKKIKRQKDNKPMLALISDYEMLKKYCVVSSEQMEYLKKVWGEPLQINKIPLTPPPRLAPGETGFIKGAAQRPVTVILENKKNLPDELTGGLNSLAVRLPRSEFLIKIIKQADFPIVSTSLNKTGEPPLRNALNLEKYFKYLPDLVIDAGECKNTKPSRLVDLRDVRNIKVIRE